MNSELEKLHPYPFEKLTALKAGITPPAHLAHIALSIGEPKHSSPAFVVQALADNLDKLAVYPSTKGIPEIRQSVARWLATRFSIEPSQLDPEKHILPVNGTREALFAITQTIIDRTAQQTEKPVVISPNPFYQIYEGAALLAGAEPVYLPCLEENNFTPDYDSVPEATWQRCQMVFICSPGNPTGSVTSADTYKKLIALSDKYGFVLIADECYSEIYCDENVKPIGLLEVCAQLGRNDFKNCLAFHSLSKRSNLPGLRSGFVAGDAALIAKFLLYRTYHGCAMPIQVQLASAACWDDEAHVIENRVQYRKKFSQVLAILREVMDVQQTDASFYLWPKTTIDEETFAKELFKQQNVTVLPGSFLSREVNGVNPGKKRIRIALVASVEECVEAAKRIRQFILENNLQTGQQAH
jgi:N-succinyldiaminopimelate aminotransferase